MRIAEGSRWEGALSPDRFRPVRFSVAAAAAVLVLSACQDPAGVGLGLIDEEQLDPNVRTVAVTGLAETPDTTIAIGIASSSNTALAQTRVLAGRVTEPVFGDARAVAYVDFLQSGALDDDAEAGDVVDAWLQLDRAYVYGDTTTTLPLELRPIQGTWSANRDYPADTLFTVGEVLSTTDVVVADTLRRFDLPASWIAANAALLVGAEFDDQFEGFALDVPAEFAAAPGAVFGFNTFVSEGSGLRVVVDEDTLLYPLSEVFSSIAVDPPAMAPTETLAIRAGSGRAIRFDADFAAVGPTPLAQARLRLPVDASLAQEGPFVRPIAPLSRLVGIRTEDGVENATPLANVAYDGDDELLVLDPGPFTQIVQSFLLTPSEGFERYELRPLSTTASLNIFPVRLMPGAPPETAPRFSLTVVGTAPQ